mmetsp:Transcript_31745/g.58177  ORF Transcript_31745/g.58177 Transcript_31745/m.58177 type:complete len:110 (-) Transcript_31745:2211-2540(-)
MLFLYLFETLRSVPPPPVCAMFATDQFPRRRRMSVDGVKMIRWERITIESIMNFDDTTSSRKIAPKFSQKGYGSIFTTTRKAFSKPELARMDANTIDAVVYWRKIIIIA